MDQESGLSADPECGSIAARRSVLSLAGSPEAPRPLLDRGRLIEVIGQSEGTIVRMHLDPKMQWFFPERYREARSRFFRFFRDIEHEVCLEETGDWPAVRLPEAARSGVLLTLDRRIYKHLYRPMSAREAAGFLGIDKKAFRRLPQEIGIELSERVPASRHGRRYSYAVFAISDVIRMRSMLSALPPSSQEAAVQ